MNEIEKQILENLKRKDNGWSWFFGSRRMTKDETIRLFEKDEKFRKEVVEAVISLATDLLSGG